MALIETVKRDFDIRIYDVFQKHIFDAKISEILSQNGFHWKLEKYLQN